MTVDVALWCILAGGVAFIFCGCMMTARRGWSERQRLQ